MRAKLALIIALAACGSDDAHHIDQLQVGDVDVTTPEDTAAAITVPAETAPGRTLTITIDSPPSHGAVASTVDATVWTYMPAPDYNGADQFSVSVTDGTTTAQATVHVTVSPVNDAPVAGSDSFAAAIDTPLSIATSTLLATCTDVDSPQGSLAITAVSGATHGTVVLDTSIITFTPDARFQGAATFAYTVSDGTATSMGTVSIAVGADNPPVATDDTAATAEDVPLVMADATLLANDTDVDQQTLAIASVTNPVNGTVTHTGTTTTFTPDANFNGTASFDYVVTDGAATDTATVTITVTPVEDAPVAGPDAVTTAEDTPVAIDTSALLANDTDVDGDAVQFVNAASGAHGTVGIAGTTITYTPAPDFNGTDTFAYTITDGTLTGTGTVTVTVTPVDDAPVANADSASTNEDTPLVVDASTLLANDTDVDGDVLAVASVGNAVDGSVALAGTTVTFTPAANFFGTASFDYTVTDGTLTATATVTVAVASVNDPPIAVPDVLVTPEDTAGSIDVLANDTDVDGDPLTVVAFTQPAHGSVTFIGSVATYTPKANFNGADAFSYTIHDGQGGSSTAAVAITVTAVNDAPVANPDALALDEDTTGSINVLANDTDVDGDALSVTGSSTPAHGAVSFSGGVASYTPVANFNGADSFTYTISDGHGGTATGTVTVNVISVNDAPVAAADTLTTAEDTAGSVDVLANDSDVDGDTLGVASFTQPAHGSVSFSGGVATYTPAANFNGADAFTYTASDGRGGAATATVSVSVTAVNDPPVAKADALTTAEDTAGTVNVLANDTDVDGDALTVGAFTQPAHGTVAFAGAIATYTPAKDFNGTDAFTYTASDGHGGTATASVLVSVTPVNDAPVAANDTLTTAEDTAGSVNLLANDSDVDGDTLTVTAHTNPAHGSVAIAGGVATYTPAANFNGADSFSYTISDGALTASANVAITVTSVNDAPVATTDTITTAEDTAGSVNVLTNDTDADGDTLTVTAHTNPAHGSVAFAGGVATYTPAANFNGADSFTYTVGDGHGGTDIGTVSVTVTAVNDAPVAKNDALTTAEDKAGNVNVLANDTDVDGDTLTVQSNTTPAHGSVAFAGGVATYTPAANFHGSDSFQYTISDGHGGTATATVAITVTSVNDPPVAVDDTIVTNEDTAGAVNVLANDTDVDGDTLTVQSHTNPAHGTVAFSGGTATYTPAASFAGTDSFTYVVTDGHGGTDTGLVGITVNAVNHAPVGVADTFTVAEDTALAGANVLTNDTDQDGDTLTAQLVAGPAHAKTFALAANGAVTYTGAQDFNGTDSFTYKAKDPSGALSASTTVTITVTAVNDAPVAVADTLTTAEDTAGTLDPTANDTDVDNDPLTVQSVTQGAHGVVTLTGNTAKYTPAANFNGSDSFTYTISDGHGGTATATVSVTVTPVNDVPVAVDDSASTNEDTPLLLSPATLLVNDTDVDGDALTVVSVSSPINGTVSLNGTITFTPTANFHGAASFTYTISDGHGGTASATVSVTVSSVNDAPVASDDPDETTTSGTAIDITLQATDVDGDALTFSIVDIPTGGTVALNGNVATYTPDPQFTGTDTFTFTANDGKLDSNVATVTITVGGLCGNGTIDIDAGEECDDGNTTPGDGCEADCTLTCGSGRAIEATVDPDTGSCYAFYDDDPRDEPTTESFCESFGGHLPAITSANENNVVLSLVGGNNPFIGFVFDPNFDDFEWVTGEDNTFRNFGAGEPNFPAGNCVQFDNDGDTWHSADCAAQQSKFICEFEQPGPSL